MTDLISSDASFTPDQLVVLAVMVDQIIPASAEHAVPSAADDTILADIASTLAADDGMLQSVIVLMREIKADGDVGAQFLALRSAYHDAVNALVTVTAQCYYRDDRVMQSLGMEPRAPFPQGYSLELGDRDSGDWSLLDPVRQRGDIYRKF